MMKGKTNRRFPRRVVKRPEKCSFCEKKLWPDYKRPEELVSFLTSRSRLVPRSTNGLCRKHQRALMIAVKRARFLALLPYTPRVK